MGVNEKSIRAKAFTIALETIEGEIAISFPEEH